MAGVVVAAVLGALVGGASVRLWMRRGRRAPAPHPAPAIDPLAGRAELISKIAHELKNPIMAVKGLASTGSRLYPSLDDEERHDLFRLIDAEAARLKLVAEEASTALKIDARTLAYDLVQADIGAAVEQAAWRTPVGDHPISVSSEPGLAARVDPLRLAEIVTHLVDNAARFSPPGSPIEVRAAGAPGGVAIEVRDHGPGIPDERKPAVFERYGTWRPPGYEEVPGAGLGLFIARAHVEAHGGRIDIEDADAGGTILRVWLPAGG